MDIKYYRKKKYNKLIYINRKGKELKEKKKLELIQSYAIPPAWNDVVIDFNNKDLFAVGIDDKGRKQYKYTINHNENSKKEKFCNLIHLGKYIDKIEKDVNKIIRKNSDSELLYIALIIKIILICNFRIGIEDNVKKYNSYGISTIEKKHLKFNKEFKIEFNGKKGVFNSCVINEPVIQSIMKKLYKQRKNTIFIFNQKKIGIKEVNQYLQSFNDNISSKDLRTWNANIITIHELLKLKLKIPVHEKERKKVLNTIIKEKTAIELHHTPTVCKKEYLLYDLYEIFINNPKEFYKYGNNPKDLFLKYLNSIDCFNH